MTFFAHKGSVTRKERRTPKKQNRCNKNKRVFKLSYLLPHCPLRRSGHGLSPVPSGERSGVECGARTHDTRNHNPMLYQLS